MTFTDEQLETLKTGGVVRVNIDGIACVVVLKDTYEKMCEMLRNRFEGNDLQPLLSRSIEESDWLSSTMNIYDEYDKHRLKDTHN